MKAALQVKEITAGSINIFYAIRLKKDGFRTQQITEDLKVLSYFTKKTSSTAA